MVYIRQIELTHFKSFGGTTRVPLLPEFTVVTGPNGSGKSNILDALLFALGLSSSKGMRADKLPDLVNSAQMSRSRSTVEANVSVTFDLNDWDPGEMDEDPEAEALGIRRGDLLWTVSRRLRVTPSGTYTSTYYMNGEPCTLQQLHEQLYRLRIYPEGYNVVLQGDVTGIISMSPRDRRQIIDELAGVAQFDRKIDQAKTKLDGVREREERCRIVEQELVEQLERLAKDRAKAEKYRSLREDLEQKSQWEAVLLWRQGQQRAIALEQQITAAAGQRIQLDEQITALGAEIARGEIQLRELDQRVKALGEDQLLKVQAELAGNAAEQRQIERQQADLQQAREQGEAQIAQLQQQQLQRQTELQNLARQAAELQERTLNRLEKEQAAAQAELERCRQAANAIASESKDWVTRQTQLRQRADAIAAQLEPGRAEQAQLGERQDLLGRRIQEQEQALASLSQERQAVESQLEQATPQQQAAEATVAKAAQRLAMTEEELQIQRQTRERLEKEEREKQRQLDKAETLTQALQETQGTAAARLITDSGLSGVHGLVANLGRVEPRYQLALEIAAGGRLGYLVVEDDGVAAAGIELLKQKKAGRITFLPMNKIRPVPLADIPAWKRPEGMVDHALNLIDCDDRYQDIFSYVFGSTVIFEDLASARRQLGKYRIVTLNGELLEPSGAMTGGSLSRRPGSLSFGRTDEGESAEVQQLRARLAELAEILDRSELKISQLQQAVKDRTQELAAARQQQRELELQTQQLQQRFSRLRSDEAQLGKQLEQSRQEAIAAQQRSSALTGDLPGLETELQQLRQQLAQLEESPIHGEWQQRQQAVQTQEARAAEQTQLLQKARQQLQDTENRRQLLGQQQQQDQSRVEELRQQQAKQLAQQTELGDRLEQLQAHASGLQTRQAELEAHLGSEKQQRDKAEQQLRQQREQVQQGRWQIEKLDEQTAERQQQLVELRQTLEQQQAELPDPLPEIPAVVLSQGLEPLQQELRSLAKRIQAMEPVNMLALEEYERTQVRLAELSEKLDTIEQERTELLLRIENFTTLRQRAFMESFDAVNANFQDIFARLSDGDGYLQLDNPEDPFSSGLNLVAHPKGKAVRRLASMSGGEKSLTALSFIFALQRYRPSPFYALDEVDSFLDGANVEKLAQVIKGQAAQAQFIVVSHRRPMIEASERTIGVTQARGTHTQVVGIPQTAAVPG